MIQMHLPKVRAIARGLERKAVKSYMATDKHATSNRIAAQVILENVEKYGPGLEKWARLFQARDAK